MLGIISTLLTAVPFSDKGRVISRLLEGLADGYLLQRHVQSRFRRDHLIAAQAFLTEVKLISGNPIGKARTGRVFAGHDTYSRRRTYRSSSISGAENHAFGRQPVDVRSFIKCTSVIAYVTPSVIVDDDEKYIGFCRSILSLGGSHTERQRWKQCNVSWFHYFRF